MVSSMLLQPRYAGVRCYYGKPVGQGQWPTIITEAEHVHSTNDEYIQQFEQLKMRLGIESDY